MSIPSLQCRLDINNTSIRQYTGLFNLLYIVAPNGLHVVTIEQKKMLNMYRIGDLSTVIGQYSMYGEIERVVFSSDSAYIVCGIADTRLFYLMLCDVEVDGHHQRALVCQ